MKEWVEVSTQAELDKAVKGGNPVIVRAGLFVVAGSSTVRASGSSTVRASGSSTVRAYGSSTVRAYGSSTVRASGSSTVRASGSSTVRAYGSSTVTAYGSSTVRAYDSSTVTAYKLVAIHIHSTKATVNGGVQIPVTSPGTVEDWCDRYGVEVTDGIAILFKAVREDFGSGRGGSYVPESVPVADDWDGGTKECGGGLHFSPRPFMALPFDPAASRFVACPVAIKDIRPPEDTDSYPAKVKAKGCAGPVWEVDADGTAI